MTGPLGLSTVLRAAILKGDRERLEKDCRSAQSRRQPDPPGTGPEWHGRSQQQWHREEPAPRARRQGSLPVARNANFHLLRSTQSSKRKLEVSPACVRSSTWATITRRKSALWKKSGDSRSAWTQDLLRQGWPWDLCKEYLLHEETERTGTKYATAGKDSKPPVERILHLQVEDGIIRGARVKVTNVRKPLISVADMNDAGQDVFFHQAKAMQSTRRSSETGASSRSTP